MRYIHRCRGGIGVVFVCALVASGLPAEPAYASSDEAFFSSASLFSGSSESDESDASLRVRRVVYPNTDPRFRLALSGAVGYTMAAGEWFDGVDHGPFAIGEVRGAINRSVYLGFSYRYQLMEMDPEITGLVDVFDENTGVYTTELWEWDVNLQQYMFLLGFMSSPSDRLTPLVYLELGFGAVYHDFQLTYSEVGTTNEGQSKTEETKFGFSSAIGAVFPLGGQIGIDFQGSMLITGDSGGYDYDTGQNFASSTGFLWGASLGVVLMFGPGL